MEAGAPPPVCKGLHLRWRLVSGHLLAPQAQAEYSSWLLLPPPGAPQSPHLCFGPCRGLALKVPAPRQLGQATSGLPRPATQQVVRAGFMTVAPWFELRCRLSETDPVHSLCSPLQAGSGASALPSVPPHTLPRDTYYICYNNNTIIIIESLTLPNAKCRVKLLKLHSLILTTRSEGYCSVPAYS